MRILTARNVHEMLPKALALMFSQGRKRDTRNGPVLQLEGPTIISYDRPWEKVVFWPERDANPFFHFMESLFYLAGVSDVEKFAYYASNMRNYSDDGKELQGSYGYRWRKHFGVDQLWEVIRALRANPDCRRQVLSMWDGHSDMAKHSFSKDVPCNTHAYVAINAAGRLDLTVCNRSNDLVWGALGANAVHFAVLLEYLAGMIGVQVGRLYQITNNLHGYLKTIEPLLDLVPKQGLASPYELGEVTAVIIEPQSWWTDLAIVGQPDRYQSHYFQQIVGPIEMAFEAYKSKDLVRASKLCDNIQSSDWGRACSEWIQRRIDKQNKRNELNTTTN